MAILFGPGRNGGPEPLSPGDLSYQMGCTFQIDGYIDEYLWGRVTLYLDGRIIGQNESSGYGTIGTSTVSPVSATTQDQSLYCHVDSNVGYGDASATIPGAGPGSATLKIAAFIRQNWVGNPADIYRVFGGDDRGFGYYQGSSRLTTVEDVYNPAVNDGDVLSGPTHGAALTEEYDITTSLDAPAPFGRLTADAHNDWIWDPPLKTRWLMADTGGAMNCSIRRLGPNPDDWTSTNEIHCTANVSDPLLWVAPGIKCDLTMKLTWGNRKIHFDVSGCHSGFPAFEAYANGSPFFQDSGSDSPSDLLYGCATSVSTSGDVQ